MESCGRPAKATTWRVGLIGRRGDWYQVPRLKLQARALIRWEAPKSLVVTQRTRQKDTGDRKSCKQSIFAAKRCGSMGPTVAWFGRKIVEW